MSEHNSTIIAIMSDLFFGMRVRAAAEQAGLSIVLLDTSSAKSDIETVPALIEASKPKLIVLDLHSDLPWRAWLRNLKLAQGQSLPEWVAFGSHIEADLLKEAKSLGISNTMAKSKFTKELPKLLQSIKRTSK